MHLENDIRPRRDQLGLLRIEHNGLLARCEAGHVLIEQRRSGGGTELLFIGHEWNTHRIFAQPL
jgi:hypothetical protein